MIADMITKGLSRVQIEKLRKLAGMESIVTQSSEKECWGMEYWTINNYMYVVLLKLQQETSM